MASRNEQQPIVFLRIHKPPGHCHPKFQGRKFSITPGKFAASGSADLPVIFPDGRRRTGFLAMQWPQGKFKP